MIVPMLSRLSDRLPERPSYIYEIKLDGQRTIAEVSKKSLLLYTRNFQIVTHKYPELQQLPQCLMKKSAILDGEIVALQEGIPSFELLQQRMSLRDRRAIQVAVSEVPVLYYVFDVLEVDGKSLLKTPLERRKQILSRALRPDGPIKILPHFDSLQAIAAKAEEFGYEGIVAKKRDSNYLPGQRTNLWIKYKFQKTDSFVILGWMEGGRSLSFGSLLVGKYRDRKLVYCGRVGTGFDERKIRELMDLFRKLQSKQSPFGGTPEAPEKIHWLKPELVAEIKFKEWTSAGNIRSPVFIALRSDISPKSCRF